MKFFQKFLTILALISAAVSSPATDTNGVTVTGDQLTASLLQVQEQLHAQQLALEQAQQAAANETRSNAVVLAARLQLLEQSVATQRAQDAEASRQMQQATLLLVGGIGLAVLAVLLWLAYIQWRAFAQFTRTSAEQSAMLANVHQLAAPGRATVETSNTRLLDVVGQLERRIHELEGGQRLLAEASPGTVNGQPSDVLTEGQKYLDANSPQAALDFFEKYLSTHPENAPALAKKAEALEKLGRNEEALAFYDRALTSDPALVTAHLHKGGLLNRLGRKTEALNCFEQALQARRHDF